MKLAIGADSAGKPLLDVIAKHLASKGVAYTDMSAEAGSPPEYYARDGGAREPRHRQA